MAVGVKRLKDPDRGKPPGFARVWSKYASWFKGRTPPAKGWPGLVPLVVPSSRYGPAAKGVVRVIVTVPPAPSDKP